MYSTTPYYVRSLTSTFASLDGGSFLNMVSTMMRHMHHGFKPCKEATPFRADDFSRMAIQFYLSSDLLFILNGNGPEARIDTCEVCGARWMPRGRPKPLAPFALCRALGGSQKVALRRK